MAISTLEILQGNIPVRLDTGDLLSATPAQLNAILGVVVGPASSTDNALIRFDTATGLLAQDSLIIVDDAGAMSGVTSLVMAGALTGATTFEFTPVNAALVTPTANILVNSALGDFDFIVGGDTVANLLMVDAGLDAVGIGVAAVAGSILTINTTTSTLEFIVSTFDNTLITPPTVTTGYLSIEIGGNACFIPCYTAIPTT